MRRVAYFATLALLLGCQGPRKPVAAPPHPAGAVATVGARSLSFAAVQREVVIDARLTDPTEPAKDLVRSLVDELVDELVVREHLARTRAVVTVATESVLNDVAARALVSKGELLNASRAQGVEAAELRGVIQRRLLIAKAWQLGPGRVPPIGLRSDAEQRASMASTYERWRRDPRRWWVDIRVLGFWTGANGEDTAYVTRSLNDLKGRAAAGEDFCKLVTLYSHDDSTRAQCGSRGPLPLRYYRPEILSAIENLRALDVAGPLRMDEGLALIQLVDEPKPRPLEEVWPEVWEETYDSILRPQLREWLDRLRERYGAWAYLSPSDLGRLEAAVMQARHEQAAPSDGRWLDPETARVIVRGVVLEHLRAASPKPSLPGAIAP